VSGSSWTVAFTITVDDLVGYVRVAQKNLNLVGSAIAIALIAAGILVTALANDTLSGAMLMIVGVSFYAFGNTDYFDRWRVRRIGRNVLGTDVSFTIDDTGIASVNASGSGRIPWSAITDVKESSRVIVFRRDGRNAAWLPKRVFASEQELAEVQQLIASRTGGALSR
jgi:hypothetical protein